VIVRAAFRETRADGAYDSRCAEGNEPGHMHVKTSLLALTVTVKVRPERSAPQ
jgi:hypothetical protein